MMIKKLSPATTTTHSFLSIKPLSTQIPARPHGYATHANTSSNSVDSWPSIHNPTPYQILQVSPSQPYTKARSSFHQLVKLYHPDRAVHPECATLAEDIRLERYRLVIAAHNLLSDPAKKKAYDTYGDGWGQTKLHLPGSTDYPGGAFGGAHGQAFRGGKYKFTHRSRNHPFMNATWEDWEEWRNKQSGSGSGQDPIFARNGSMATALLVFALLVGGMQVLHVDQVSTLRQASMEERHQQYLDEMKRRRDGLSPLNRDQRIEKFARTKDPSAFRNKQLADMVLNPDLCASGDELGTSTDLNMRRKFVNRER